MAPRNLGDISDKFLLGFPVSKRWPRWTLFLQAAAKPFGVAQKYMGWRHYPKSDRKHASPEPDTRPAVVDPGQSRGRFSELKISVLVFFSSDAPTRLRSDLASPKSPYQLDDLDLARYVFRYLIRFSKNNTRKLIKFGKNWMG